MARYKYIESFEGIIKEKGMPNLSPDQFIRLVRIFSVEYHLRGLRKWESKKKKDPNMEMFEIEKKLTLLTGNENPERVLKEMLLFSKNEH